MHRKAEIVWEIAATRFAMSAMPTGWLVGLGVLAARRCLADGFGHNSIFQPPTHHVHSRLSDPLQVLRAQTLAFGC